MSRLGASLLPLLLTAPALALVPTGLSGNRVDSSNLASRTKQPWSLSLSSPSTSTAPTTASRKKLESMPWTKNTKDYGEFDMEDWGWVYTTVRDDASSSFDCANVEGEIPSDLQGTYYKVGPGNFERDGRRYAHVLDGDGFVVSFQLDGTKNQVKYTGRFVETEYYQSEQEQDKVLYRNVFGTQPPGSFLKNAFDMTLKNVANTNIINWGNRLFALWEAGRPYELDPNTLETLARPATKEDPFDQLLGEKDAALRGVTIDQGGRVDQLMNVGRFFTAHPHIVDDGETLVGFASCQDASTKETVMDFVEFDQAWNQKHQSTYRFADGAGAPHDFSVGSDYYAFFQNTITMNQLPYILGLKSPTQIMQLQLDQPTILHLASRNGKTPSKQVKVPPYFTVHSVPLIEEDGPLVSVYSNGWDLSDRRYFPEGAKSVPFLGAWGGRYPDFDKHVPPSLLYRTTVNVETNELISHEEVLPGLVVDFMTQDEQTPHIHYMSLADTSNDSLPSVGYARVNAKENSVETWWAEPKIFTGELMPVPKQQKAGSCWLLGLLYDASKKRTSLAILDSDNFEDGPVARIHLPHYVSFGLHGFFSPSSDS